jgi:hypothetical protein
LGYNESVARALASPDGRGFDWAADHVAFSGGWDGGDGSWRITLVDPLQQARSEVLGFGAFSGATLVLVVDANGGVRRG